MNHVQAYILLTLAVVLGRAQNNDGNDFSNGCRTVEGENGNCISIRQCAPLLQLLRDALNNPSVLEYLQRSQCGQGEFVCCPSNQNSTSPGKRDNGNAVDNSDFPDHLPSPPICGKSDISFTRIVGGVASNLGSWPWLVVYGYRSRRNPNIETQWLCGGALVTERHTITAAHCTQHPSLTMYVARLGELNLDPDVNDGADPLDIPVVRAIKHPQYKSFQNDIAIVVLQRPVTYTNLIRPICLPFPMRNEKFVGKSPFVAGWGSQEFKGASSKQLMHVQIPIVENDGCAVAYRTVGGDITERQLCAGGKKNQKDACQGDSGGPLMLPRGQYYYLVGVVSYGYRCATPGFPGIYTRVTSYMDWIEENLKR